jgi:anion-transporting  ArsA/GET3 family ATPase
VAVGLRAHAEKVEDLLKADSTTFIWVTTPRASAVEGTLKGIEALQEMHYPIGHILLNRVAAQSREAFPELKQPKSITPPEWASVKKELKHAWTLAGEKAKLHENVRSKLEAQVSAPTTCIQTVSHEDDPLHIIQNVANQLNELAKTTD